MIVIDASVAIKLINTQEEGSSIAMSLLISHRENKERIIVPEFLFIEVANYLATKTTSTKYSIKKGLLILYGSGFLIYNLNENDLTEASFLAKRYKTSVYDMLYAVIAKSKKIKLITADDKFARKVGFSYVKHLSEATSATLLASK